MRRGGRGGGGGGALGGAALADFAAAAVGNACLRNSGSSSAVNSAYLSAVPLCGLERTLQRACVRLIACERTLMAHWGSVVLKALLCRTWSALTHRWCIAEHSATIAGTSFSRIVASTTAVTTSEMYFVTFSCAAK